MLSIPNTSVQYNIVDYGAVGDGTTDNSGAIQKALDAASNQGNGTVLIPSGEWGINPSIGILVPSNTRLVGVGLSSVIRIINQSNTSGNVVKTVGTQNVELSNFLIDGNKANQSSGTNYGLFVSTATNCTASNVKVKNCAGVGIQLYNSTGCSVTSCHSTGNAYHGFEVEQCTNCTVSSSRGSSNSLHGILVSPGEVGGTGSRGNMIIGNSFDNNTQYGIALNAANGDISAFLSEGNIFSGNSVTSNGQYGINIYKQDKQVFTGNYVYNNGFFGLYGLQSSNNIVENNFFHNNSQASNGAYDEVLFEGSSSGHAAVNNNISGNTILIDGAVKARYAVNEGTSSDGPNIITNNNVPSSGTSGKINSIVTSDITSSPGGVVQIGDNGQAIQGANAGFDSAFSHILRLFNNFTSGSTQIVTPNGSVQFYTGGNNTLNVSSIGAQFQPGVSVTAGGATMYTLGSTGLIVSVGSGVPTQSAPQGSLYLRTDGSSTSTRLYVNSNGSTSWVSVTTAS